MIMMMMIYDDDHDHDYELGLLYVCITEEIIEKLRLNTLIFTKIQT